MAAIELKPLNIDITKIMIRQQFGFKNTYWKDEFIKHKKRKIDGYMYNTLLSELICYYHYHINDNNYQHMFIYRAQNGNYFSRQFLPYGEEKIKLVDEKYVLIYLNKNKSLF